MTDDRPFYVHSEPTITRLNPYEPKSMPPGTIIRLNRVEAGPLTCEIVEWVASGICVRSGPKVTDERFYPYTGIVSLWKFTDAPGQS